jgi:hypothetical protein
MITGAKNEDDSDPRDRFDVSGKDGSEQLVVDDAGLNDISNATEDGDAQSRVIDE